MSQRDVGQRAPWHGNAHHADEELHDTRLEGHAGDAQITEQAAQQALEAGGRQHGLLLTDVHHQVQHVAVPVEAEPVQDADVARPLDVLEGLHHERIAPRRLRLQPALVHEAQRAPAHRERAEVRRLAREPRDHVRQLLVPVERQRRQLAVQAAALVEHHAQARRAGDGHAVAVLGTRQTRVQGVHRVLRVAIQQRARGHDSRVELATRVGHLAPHAVQQRGEKLASPRGLEHHVLDGALENAEETADERDVILLGGVQNQVVQVGGVRVLREAHHFVRMDGPGRHHIHSVHVRVVQ